MAVRPDERTQSSTADGKSSDRVAQSAHRPIHRTEASADAPLESRAAPPADLALDTERFLAGPLIGQGGSSVVIRAFDRDILRDVAVKVLDRELADSSEFDRFAEEARIHGQLEHPNIAPVYELGLDRRGRRFLCMKLIEGTTLEQTLFRLGESRLEAPELAKLLQVFGKVCDAVAFAHSRGVIHRDLKPTNVMISDFGQVYVLDWGIARLRPPEAGRQGPRVRVSAGCAGQSEFDPPGSLVGTACYMSPEQLQGQHEKLDERTDIFALGATLYQILTGLPPLTAESVRAIWMRKPAPAIVAPDRMVAGGRVPPELSKIALRALAHDPAERYATVGDMQRDIDAFQRGSWDLPRTSLPAGSTIILEGEPGNAAYVILEGRCVAYRVEGSVETELRAMGPGDVFGEAAVFSNKPRTASVRAVSDVRLLVVTREVLSNAVGLSSWMGGFVKALATRFLELDERLRSTPRPTSLPIAHAPGGARTGDDKR
ncbi:MAG: serine/threonine-protein kinase [Myxococcota bacterium]|nr:serine/threonine-protein kinase [Myxococcota bacterium]